MYRNILVAYHGDSQSHSALYECQRLLPAHADALIHVLVVIDVPSTPVISELGVFVETTYETDLQLARDRALAEARQACAFLQDYGLNIALQVDCGDPVQVIADAVEALNIELVIIGHSRQKPFSLRWWRGPTDAILVEKVRCSVLVATDKNGEANS